MELFGISIQGTVKPNVKILAIPAILVVVLAILALIVGQRGVTQITIKIKDLQGAQKIESSLENRVTILDRLEGVVLSQADVALIALPEKDPTLLMLSQLKTSAEEYGLVINSLTTRAQAGSELVAAREISFLLEGDFPQVIAYLKQINTLAPVSTLEAVNLKVEGSTLTASTVLNVYWGAFPTELPAITKPITELDNGENLLLSKVSSLKTPEFINLNPSTPAIREDPFN